MKFLPLYIGLIICILYFDGVTSHRRSLIDKLKTFFNKKTSTFGKQNSCEKQGLLCKDCSTLVRCVEEYGGFREYVIDKCNTTHEEFCWNNEQCSTSFNPVCQFPDYVFKCTNIGMFPDPFDCKKYHVCTKDFTGLYHDHQYNCAGNYTYNMITTYCDINEQCTLEKMPVPPCKTEGETGTTKNYSIWYICKKYGKVLIPELHLCATGKIYNIDRCMPNYIKP